MSLIELKLNPTRSELRVFAALQMLFCGLVSVVVYRRTGSIPVAVGIVSASCLLGIVGLCAPRGIRYVYIGWMAAVFPIGWCVSHAVLAMVYFGVLTPIGLCMRLFHGDILHRRLDPSASSHWVRRRTDIPTSRYFQQF